MQENLFIYSNYFLLRVFKNLFNFRKQKKISIYKGRESLNNRFYFECAQNMRPVKNINKKMEDVKEVLCLVWYTREIVRKDKLNLTLITQ